MRIACAGLLLVAMLALVACVHETTVFHSPTGATYFKGASIEAPSPPGVPATAANPAGEPVPSR